MSQSTALSKRELTLDGLHCANCAMKIENGVGKIKGVSSCSVNFVNKTLTLEANETEAEHIAGEAMRTVNRIEPHIRVRIKPVPAIGKVASTSTQATSDSALTGQAAASSAAASGHTSTSNAHITHPYEHADHQHEDAHEHDHAGHTHSHDGGHQRKLLFRLLGGGVFMVAGLLLPMPPVLELSVFLLAYIIAGGDIVWQALRNIARGQVFDEYFLMSVATIGAFAIGQYPEGVAVMLFYQLGEMFQGAAVERSRRSIAELMNIRPDYANVQTAEGIRQVSPEQIRIGDWIVIRPGEKVPLDGIVVEGSSMLDTSALTGESVPREAKEGSEVLAGFVNKNGVLTLEVERIFSESSVSKILELVQNASSKKAQTEKFITRFARYYTPAVVIIATLLAIVPPLLLNGATFSDWIYRALVFLVISCPCALVVSIPLGFFGGIGAASKNGILIKGSNYLEALNHVKYVVFDKTGTLTKGTFAVTAIRPATGFTEEQLLDIAAHTELHSSHPIAESIRNAYQGTWNESRVTEYSEAAGYGIEAKLDGQQVLAGNYRLLQREGIEAAPDSSGGTVVYVAVNGKFAGTIVISDEVKSDAASAIHQLKQQGIRRVIMLTGDTRQTGEAVGRQLGVDEVHAELLPQDKVMQLERLDALRARGEKIIFVGDGINDTPVLARADIGVAMGGLGSDAAIEAADVVIMNDEPSRLPVAIEIARRTRRIVWQNIIFALGVKAVFLLLGAFGIATMWEAVFSDVGVTLLAVLNAMRVLRFDSSRMSKPVAPPERDEQTAAI
ncbi:heavy metal translocating P-type ATPase [Paenibacillus hunanensis]|uniref:heavy metal translocating P-type ATPase n=1 Tax=Paenibacillus hunanensis TaxID=539262 RepID=UPI002A699C26|nr:heavy metal translocating P-type ATPase [Paenibacillus hunanensis]WPP43437.1 heavy metal translocating P-type ATPase [Paenibacillus hunanensis]